MENENLTEIMDEEFGNELSKIDHKTKIAATFGIGVVLTSALIAFKFKNKISTKLENMWIKKLTKKGYSIHSSEELDEFSKNLFKEEEL